MSGRGRGRFQGGRGRSSAGRSQQGNKKPTAKSETKKTLTDYTYHLGSAKQASDYDLTTQYLVTHVKVTYEYGEDIAYELEELEPIDTEKWRPQLRVSKSKDPEIKAAEKEQFGFEFKTEYSEYRKRIATYNINRIKASALLWQRCTVGMRNKIEARVDYKNKIKDNPIELLKAIREHALNYQEHRYDMSIVFDAYKNLFNLKQKEGESLHDYTKRFRVAREVLESHIGGPIVLHKVCEAVKDYDKESAKKLDTVWKTENDRFLSYVYLENADQAKYGSILSGLNTQQSLGNNQYPKTPTEANHVLSNHKFDGSKQQNKNKPATNLDNQTRRGENRDRDEEVVLSFAQLEGKCYCCGKAGHKSPQCRHKNKPREEWAINRAEQQSHVQSNATETPTVTTTTTNVDASSPPTSDSTVAWAGVHSQLYQGNAMRDWILLDNQSTATIFCNPNLVTNIHKAKGDFLELVTNAGVLRTNLKATVPGWGLVWYSPDAITNIFSYAEMAKRHKITYNSDREDAFIVHLPAKNVKFERIPSGLYVFKPKIRHNGVQFLSSIAENKEFFTARQFERAKRARDLFNALGTPSPNDMKAILRMNLIGNNPVTNQDIDLAHKIFGIDIGQLKGKTTRRTPAPVVADYIEIPRELVAAQLAVTLCIDTMKVNGLNFLTTVSKNLYYRTAQFLENRTPAAYEFALREIFAIYNKAGFRIVEIRADNEFHAVLNRVQELFRVHINYANPQEHVPEAERNNRVLKERIRAAYHRLPYQQLTRVMTKILVMESAKKLNFFPAKHGISPYYSPRMILHAKTLDFNKHCRYAFGSYVQGHDEPGITNTNLARTSDCIYLRYNDAHQGGHELLHLPTNRMITRRNITETPITPAVISQITRLAEHEHMPPGLKIKNKTNITLYDSAWIAGVDYQENEEEEEDENDNNNAENENDNTNNNNNENDEIQEHEVELIQERDEMHPDDIEAYEDNHPPPNEPDDNPVEVEEAHEIEQITEDDNNDEEVNLQEEEAQEEEEPVEDEVQPEPEPTNVDADPDQTRTRSGRVSIPPARYRMQYQHLQTQTVTPQEYSNESARVLSVIMNDFNNSVFIEAKETANQFVQTYSLKKGMKKFGERGKNAAYDEMKQLHDRVVFAPINVDKLTSLERRRAMESLIFMTEKRDGRIKARTCANGSTQRDYIGREEAASPTATTESHLITAVIDAKQGRDVMTADIPNAFVQTEIDKKDIGDRIIMKIQGPLVDMLTQIAPEIYQDYVTSEKGNKVLYVEMLKALYGMLQSSLLYYKKFRKDIEEIGFEINPYDPCVANRIVHGKQHTITWHVDDLKSSHVNPKVNDHFLVWLNKKYASDNIGEVKATRGKRHDYLAMMLDFSEPSVLKVDMTNYVKGMVDDFPYALTGKTACPWSENLFKVDENVKKLPPERAKIFHTFVMKGMFLCKRARQDIQPGIAFLATRVRDPNENDWAKLIKVLNFLKATQNDVCRWSADNTQTITWYVDSAFAVHKDMKSHTGGVMTLGFGVITSDSTKQKANARSSTEAEMIAADDLLSKILWTKRFIEAQGHTVKANILYRDNKSAMKLEANGKASSGKRTRHFDIKFFYITDLIKRNEIQIEFCPTDDMLADYMTKPLTGMKFVIFRERIMNYG